MADVIDPAVLSPDPALRLRALYESLEAERAGGDPPVGDTVAGLAAIFIRETARDGDEAQLRDLALWIQARLAPRMMQRMPVGALTN